MIGDMDVEEYRAARRLRLIGLAVELGVPEGDADLVVDQVIEEQRRRIGRAEDPDDVVVPALREKIQGGRPRGAYLALLGVFALIAACLVVPLLLDVDDDRAPTVPSLLGLTADEAAFVLERDDIALRVVGVPQCDPVGQVLGSVPPMGSAVEAGDVVTVIATSAPAWQCSDDAAARASAWKFLRFLVSGSARPDFAPGVRLFVNGEKVTMVAGAESASTPGWRTLVRDPVVRYVSRPVENDLGQPVVSVTRGVPPAMTCGHPRAKPSGAVVASTRMMLTVGDGSSLGGCELTIDLFDNPLSRISTVAIYTP